MLLDHLSWSYMKTLCCATEMEPTRILKWKITHPDNSSDFRCKLNNLIAEIDEADNFYIWTQLVHCLSLCYKFHSESKYSESLAMIEKCQSIVTTMAGYGGCFAGTIDGLQAIVGVTKADVALAAIETPRKLSGPGNAAINGVLAAFLSVFKTAGRDMMKHSERAVALDPTNELWHFVRAQCLRGLRDRGESQFRAWRESLEAVVEMTNRPWPMVYAADEYRTSALNQSAASDSSELYSRAKELYDKAGNSAGKSDLILSRVITGYLYLPASYKNVKQTRQYVSKLKTLEKRNAISYFALGLYHERVKIVSDAMAFYEKSVSMGFRQAARNLLKLKNKTLKSYNPTDDLIKLLEFFPDEAYFRVDILCQLISYEFYFNGNLMAALPFWCQATDIKTSCNFIKKHYSWFGYAKEVDLRSEICRAAKREMFTLRHKGEAQDLLLRACLYGQSTVSRKAENLKRELRKLQRKSFGTNTKEQRTEVARQETISDEISPVEEYLRMNVRQKPTPQQEKVETKERRAQRKSQRAECETSEINEPKNDMKQSPTLNDVPPAMEYHLPPEDKNHKEEAKNSSEKCKASESRSRGQKTKAKSGKTTAYFKQSSSSTGTSKKKRVAESRCKANAHGDEEADRNQQKNKATSKQGEKKMGFMKLQGSSHEVWAELEYLSMGSE